MFIQFLFIFQFNSRAHGKLATVDAELGPTAERGTY